jgi:transposase
MDDQTNWVETQPGEVVRAQESGAATPGRGGRIWRQRNGVKWRAVPGELGPWWRAAQRHIRRSRAGVWERALAVLREAGQPGLGEVFLDGTNMRARRKAAGAKGGQRPMPPAARAAATAQGLRRL